MATPSGTAGRSDATPLIIYAGYVSILLITVSVGLILLPGRFAGRLPKLAKRLRSRLLAFLRRSRELSAEGPFYRLAVWFARKLGQGRLSSRCTTPDLRAKATGCREVQASFGPRLPFNPFHEEHYVLAWCRADEPEPKWRERPFHRDNDCEKAGGRLRVFLDALPEHAALRFRACAENRWGRSGWSEEARLETLAMPSEEGGFTGPVGAACSFEARYTWYQTHSEVFIKVPLVRGIKARDIRLKPYPARLDIRHAAAAGDSAEAPEILVGPLAKKVKADEVFWTVEEDDKKFGRHLSVQLVKVDPFEKWPCLIEADGHPKIDVRLMRSFAEGMNGGMGGGGGGLFG